MTCWAVVGAPITSLLVLLVLMLASVPERLTARLLAAVAGIQRRTQRLRVLEKNDVVHLCLMSPPLETEGSRRCWRQLASGPTQLF